MGRTSVSSPRVTSLEWGRVEVDGHGEFKDVKLWPGGARAWDWNETGTRHKPGVQVSDAQELLDNGAEVVILTRGVDLVLQVGEDVVSHLEDLGVEVHVAQTEEAVALYNDLAGNHAVGILIHSTC